MTGGTQFPPSEPALAPRPAVPRPVVLLAWTVVVLLLLAFLCGGGALAVLHVGLRQGSEEARRELRTLEEEDARRRDVRALLGQLSDHFQARQARTRGDLPETPGEPLPGDPWGTEIRYEWNGPARVVLRSAGPDRKFRTPDDVTQEVTGR